MSVKKVILIGSGVRETYLAKRLFIDTNGQIAITVILTKRNPEISSYAKNVFLINKHDKFAKDTNVISVSGSIIIERLRQGLPTYHCCDTYYAKPLKKYRYCSSSDLLYLIEDRVSKDNFIIDENLKEAFKKLIFSGSIVQGNIWTKKLNLKVINKCFEKITCGK